MPFDSEDDEDVGYAERKRQEDNDHWSTEFDEIMIEDDGTYLEDGDDEVFDKMIDVFAWRSI